MSECKKECGKPEEINLTDHIKFEEAILDLETSTDAEWNTRKDRVETVVRKIKKKYHCSVADDYEQLYDAIVKEDS